jgi:mannosyltransferase
VCLAVVGYLDIVALSVLAGHAAGAALRWWRGRDGRRLVGFAAAAAAALVACAPLAAASVDKAGGQVYWIQRPGLDVSVLGSLAGNLFFSTSVAAAVVILGVLAWAADWQAAAFATAMAVLPAAAVWLLSQGPHSYFFGRYLLFTVGAWAILAGIALSRLDPRPAAVAVLVIGVFGAGDQQVVRTTRAHSWASYPGDPAAYYLDYAGAAAAIAHSARAEDGIIYREGRESWKIIAPGLEYYLQQDMPHGVPVPRELFVAATVPQSSQVNPQACAGPPRAWATSP